MRLMNVTHAIGWVSRRVGVLCSASVLLAACTTSDLRLPGFLETPVYNKEYRQFHAVAVESVRLTLSLPGADGQERLTPGEIRRVDEFVSGYMAERRGQLLVSIPAGASGERRVLGRAKQIADRARRQGLPADQIMLRVAVEEDRADAPVVVGYDKFVVRVPECGDWSKESSHDLTNTQFTNFGCATQRAIGLMVADPADLISPRQAGLRDAGRSNTVIQLYRTGQPTSAERTEAEEAEAVEVE